MTVHVGARSGLVLAIVGVVVEKVKVGDEVEDVRVTVMVMVAGYISNLFS